MSQVYFKYSSQGSGDMVTPKERPENSETKDMDVSEIDCCRKGNNNEESLEERGIWRNSKRVSIVAREGTRKRIVGVEAG